MAFAMKLICSLLFLCASITACIAGTYTLQSVSVTHSGGWPSYTTGHGTPHFDWNSQGGAVAGSTYKDGFYKLNSTFSVETYASVPSSSAYVAHLYRNDIVVSYTIQFVEGYSGETPASVNGTADTRYTLEATNQATDTSSYMYDLSQAGLSGTWMDCLAETYGPAAADVFYPSQGAWQFYQNESVTFGSWTQVSSGVWQATGTVGYASGTQEYDLRHVHYGTAQLHKCTGYGYGEWQYRLKTVTAGGVTVISQPGF